MSIIRSIKKLLHFAGIEPIKVGTAKVFLPHLHMASLFHKLDIRCVLDIGANVGGFRDFLRDAVGYQGLILSFEPVSHHYEIIKARSQQDAQWEVYYFALGSQSGELEINVMRSGDFSSFLDPDHSVVTDFKDENVVLRKERTQVKTLDEIMPQLVAKYSPKRIFLKLDTQGFDLEVVKGAQESLKRILALQTEVSMRPIYRNMPGFLESYQVLSGMGFDVAGLFPVSSDELMRVNEFDCLMVNSRFFDNDESGFQRSQIR